MEIRVKYSGPILDAWAQPALVSFFERVPEVASLLRRSGTRGYGHQDLSPRETVELMDAAGIQRVTLRAWHRPGSWVCSNEEVARFTTAYPDRFVGIASVNLENPVEAVRELKRAVNEYGFRALALLPWLWNRPPNDRFYFPLYVACIDLKIPFCTQIGQTGPLMPSEPGRPVPYLDEVALIFPELRIVGGHLGYPWTDEMIGLSMKHANVYIDTSAHLPSRYPPQLLEYMKTSGRSKVLFATNFPHLNWAKCVEQALNLDLPEPTMRRFFYSNAMRVFGLA